MHPNIISESEAISIATEAEKVKVADLPVRESLVKENDINGSERQFLAFSVIRNNNDDDIIQTNSASRNAQKFSYDGKGDSDLQVSIVSSTDVAPDAFSRNLSKESVSFDGKQTECHICGKVLAKRKNLRWHLNTHIAKNRYSCLTCGKSYAWKNSLVDHLKVNKRCADAAASSIPSDAAIYSEVIPNDFHKRHDAGAILGSSSIRSKKVEVAFRHESSQYRNDCIIDMEPSSAEAGIESPISSHENTPTDKSQQSYILKGSNANERNLTSPIGEQEDFIYPCVDCGQPFKDEEQMWKHFETKHCILDQSSTSDVITVTKTNPVFKSTECLICHKLFSSPSAVNEHLTKHTGLKRFSCPVCDRKFAWRGSVRKHLLRTACGDGRKSCSSSSPAIDTSTTAAHKMTSKGIEEPDKNASKNYNVITSSSSFNSDHVSSSKEDQSCFSSASKEQNPNIKLVSPQRLLDNSKHAVMVEEYVRQSILHQEGFGVKKEIAGFVDVGNGPELGHHVCKLCSKEYKYKSSLKLHMREHTGEVPYQCRMCQKRFASQKNCRKHVLKHAQDSGSDQLKFAIQKVLKPGHKRKEGGEHRDSCADLNSNGSNKELNLTDCAQRDREQASRRDRYQQNVKAKAPENVVETSEKRKLGCNEMSSIGNRFDVADTDTGTNENVSCRETRKRTVKYFDLGEDSDDDIPTKRKRKSLNKVVKDSLGMSEQPVEGRARFEEELRFEWRQRKNEEDGEYRVSDEEEEEEGMLEQEEMVTKTKSSWNHQSTGGHSSMSHSPNRHFKQSNDEGDHSHSKTKAFFKCKVCDTKFSSRFVLRRHEVITGHAKASYECPYCKRIYSEGGAYSNHMFVHQRENGMNCDICGKELLSRTTFLNHVEMHRKNPFTCKLCFEWFPSDERLQSHIATSHDEQKEFKCKYCYKTFDWQSNYSRHMNKHTNKKEFKCKICHYSFNIISNLKRHMVSVHKGETGLETSTWEAINPAQVDHVLNRQHQRRDLWQVKREEDDEATSPGKRRGRLKALKAKNRKKYNCEICDFLCSSRVELTNHLRFAHQQSNDPKTALIHFVIEDENFVCQLCGSVIYVRHSLKNHMRKVHKMEINETDIAGVSKSKHDTEQDSQQEDDVEAGERAGDAKDLTEVAGILEAENEDLNGLHIYAKQQKSGQTFRSTQTDTKPDNYRKRVQDTEVGLSSGRKVGANNNLSSYTDNDKEGPSGRSADPGSSQTGKGARMNCSLCKDSFESKDMLVLHLRQFHKIPAGLEETLIQLTKDVNSVKSKTQAKNNSVKQFGFNDQSPKSGVSKATRKMENSFKCPICSVRFESLSLLERHAAICDNFGED